MQDSPGPVYEVTLEITGHDPEEVDSWLAGHVQGMLGIPGFVAAQSWRLGDETHDRVYRVTQYQLESRQALEDYLAGPAAAMRDSTAQRFGDQVHATRRVLESVPAQDPWPGESEDCRNCGARLSGQYCSRCGQRARGRLISLWELLQDAFGDLFELDSRLWQTLLPLMFRPGRLTRDYLLGRRARFMPPFRTYLVLSVVFFLVAFFDPQQQFGILLEPVDEADTTSAENAKTAAEIRQQVLDDLESEGIIVGDDSGPATREEASKPPATPQTPDAGNGVNIDIDGCDLGDMDLQGLPDWLSRRLTPDRVQHICEKIQADSGKEFVNRLLDNVPAALFILLPLMAFVLKLLYPLSKRYYVEHLLFVVHFHAFFFLILTLQVLVSRLAGFTTLAEAVDNLTVLAISIYIPAYLYKAMRRVYEQGRAITTLKFIMLAFSYLVGFGFMLLITTFYTAFSI